MSLPFETTPMLKEYLEYQISMEKKYGYNTVVFMEVGSFYEVYEIELDYNIGKTKKISSILNLQITKKSKKLPHSLKNPFMVGFPNQSLDKFVSRLIDNNYTIITVIQIDTNDDGSKSRKIDKIYSPATYIDNITQLSNYLVCVYTETYNNITYGYLSAIDFNTGDSKVYTTFDNISNKNKCENDIFRFIHSLNPKEVLFNQNDYNKDQLTNKYKLTEKIVHTRVIPKEYKKLPYQNQFLRKIFNPTNCEPIEYIELTSYPDLVISFIFLLQFAYEHDHTIIKKIKKPYIILDKNHLILNNDSIYQLNVINTDKKSTKFSSLFNLVDNTVTNMGKRLLKERLLYPITDVKQLEKRYDMIDNMKPCYKKFSDILSNISDIEFYHRRIYLKKLDPHEFYMINMSYKYILDLLRISHKFFNITKSTELFTSFYSEYNKIFDIESMQNVKLQLVTESIFHKGIHKDIDNITKKISDYKSKLYALASVYTDDKKHTVKVIKSSDGYYIQTTNNVGDSIKKKYTDIYVKKLKSNTQITSDEIDEISNELCENENQLSKLIREKYINTLLELYTKNRMLLLRIIDIVSELDVVCSSVKVSTKYYYNRPVIKKSHKSFVNITDIRHPLIERIIDTEYEVNDINLDKKSGMLIYGVNASGKSSIIRAIGCNIILAQAGMFVSSKTFEYYPYNLLLSKISCQDNLFKGQSTFISEALEIKNMIQRSDNRTLVLADELCAGTEGLSATSLVGSTIIQLTKTHASFIFSTHLHSLMDIEQIKNSNSIYIKHFGVNIKDNYISYDRKLKDGHGNSLYGLEIAKSLNIGSEFMKQAFQFRSILEKKNIQILNTKTSRYNSSLYVDECKLCKKNENTVGPLHTHHINFQKNSDICGFIKDKHFHKNTIHNLVILCSECHQNIHKGLLTL